MQPNKRASFKKETVTRLLKYVTGTYRLRFIAVLAFIVISSAASVAGSLFLEVLIDSYITPLIGVSNPVFTGLLWAIGTMGLIYLAGVVSTYVYNRQMVIIGQGVQKRIRDEMFTNMQKLPISYFDQNSYGDIMSRYTNDIDTLRQMISQSIPNLFSSCVTLVMVFCAMLYTSIPLTALLLVAILAMLMVTRSLMGKSSKHFVQQQKNLGEVNGYIEETINGQKVVKVFCHEDAAIEEFNEKNERLFQSGDQANKYANIMMPVLSNMSNLVYVMVAMAGGAMALGGIGALTLGGIVTFLQLTKSFSQPISQMSQQVNSIIMALAGAERIFELMDQQPEEDDGNITLVYAQEASDGRLYETDERTGMWAWKQPRDTGGAKYTRVRGDIVLDDVEFSYDGEKTVLYDVSLYAKPGQKIAFVGATGAGKTTITNLINRFYDIDKGRILYDGIDIRNIRKADLRRSLGIVLQDTHLFTGTVMENIRYGNLAATDDEVIAAAKLAGAHGFISRLPNGYDTELSGDGSGLSQGQRQLLSIARAAVADPPVMILDEATSSIDTRTEKLVQDGMDALMIGRTVLVIAHRLSTIRNSDAIMVLEHGHITERGNHKELIEYNGNYYQLYNGAYENMDEMSA